MRRHVQATIAYLLRNRGKVRESSVGAGADEGDVDPGSDDRLARLKAHEVSYFVIRRVVRDKAADRHRLVG